MGKYIITAKKLKNKPVQRRKNKNYIRICNKKVRTDLTKIYIFAKVRIETAL